MNREDTTGWGAVALSTIVVSFWAWWGITDNFHEGWFYASFFRNVGWMFYRYMSPMIVFLSLGILSAAWPKVGGPLHILAGVMIPLLFPERNLLAMLLMIVPLVVLGVLYYRSSPPPFLHAVTIMAVFPVLLTMVLAIEPIIRIMGRIDDGYYGTRVIKGNGVTLVWAPEGPGWPNVATSWDEARQICLYLTADGRSIADTPQNIWRLPTVDEAVRSMTRHEVNCNGIWDPRRRVADYDKTPDKESPLWKVHSPVVYWWTSTEVDSLNAYKIVCNGKVFKMEKKTRERAQAFRAVRDVTPADTASPATQFSTPDSTGVRGKRL
jgi:hypothetical protein